MNKPRIKVDSDVLLTAKECAARIGLTVRGLRLYESRGLISPGRTAKDWRLYGATEISRLHEILALKRMGLSLAQIAKLLEGRAVDLDRTLAVQRSTIMQQRQRADDGLALVDAARAKLSANGALSITDLIALAKESNLDSASFDAIAQRRYEQARPRIAVRVDPAVLERYVGHFRFEDGAKVVTITREGDRLFARVFGQSAWEIFPESDHEFFLKVAVVQIAFVVEPDGSANALVLHQRGLEEKAVRVDEWQAQQAAAALDAKVSRNKPTLGTEAALRDLIAQCQRGSVDSAGMTEALAALMRNDVAVISTELDRAGALQSVRFRGVGRDGCDVYDVGFANGDTEWRLALTQDGKMSTLFLRWLP
jgi:DNA-binding transcriptional MerR regulator